MVYHFKYKDFCKFDYMTIEVITVILILKAGLSKMSVY